MNKIFNKIFANRIQGHNKNIILNDQVGLHQWYRDCSTHAKERNHMVIAIDTEMALKVQENIGMEEKNLST